MTQATLELTLPRRLVQPDGAIEYRTIDKSAWGEGPWQDEPDKVQWTDEATALPCLMVRQQHAGHWCGYVGVPPWHPAFGLAYDGALKEEFRGYMDAFRADMREGVTTPTAIERPAVVPGAGEAVSGILVHGGLTYADGCQEGDEAVNVCHLPGPGAPDNVWWFGFDCHHFMDFAPGMDADLRQMGIRAGVLGNEEVYRDAAYVKAEVADLARQLAAIA